MTNEGQNDSEDIQELALRIPDFKRMKICGKNEYKSYRTDCI